MMGLAAQSVAARLAAAERPGAQEWLRRGAAHLAVVGATEDARSAQVQLDAQLALAGDEQAAKRLVEAAADPGTEPMNVMIARVGLAEIAIRHERHAEAIGHTTAVAGLAERRWVPNWGVLARSTATVLRLRAADIAPSPSDRVGADEFAVSQLRAARPDALSTGDIPTLAAWALAGAELAAYRGRDDDARELWALAARLGARVVYLFQEGHGPHLRRALGDRQQREPLLAGWRARPIPVGIDRMRALMAELIGA
jgi:hypothetical protein